MKIIIFNKRLFDLNDKNRRNEFSSIGTKCKSRYYKLIYAYIKTIKSVKLIVYDNDSDIIISYSDRNNKKYRKEMDYLSHVCFLKYGNYYKMEGPSRVNYHNDGDIKSKWFVVNIKNKKDEEVTLVKKIHAYVSGSELDDIGKEELLCPPFYTTLNYKMFIE